MAKKIIILLIIILFTLSPLGISANTIDLQIQILQLQIKVLQLQVQRLLILLEQAFTEQFIVQEIQDIQALSEPTLEIEPVLEPKPTFIGEPYVRFIRYDDGYNWHINFAVDFEGGGNVRFGCENPNSDNILWYDSVESGQSVDLRVHENDLTRGAIYDCAFYLNDDAASFSFTVPW